MKNFLMAAVIVAIAGTAMAGGELPAVYVREVPAPTPVYVQPVQKSGFLNGVKRYFVNRFADVGDVAWQSIDAVVGVVTLDPAKDDI